MPYPLSVAHEKKNSYRGRRMREQFTGDSGTGAKLESFEAESRERRSDGFIHSSARQSDVDR